MRKTIEQAMADLERSYDDGTYYRASVMKKLRMRSPDIKGRTTPERAAKFLARQIKTYSRKFQHVYDVETFRVNTEDGRLFIGARLFVLAQPCY